MGRPSRPRTYVTYKHRRQQRERWAARYERDRNRQPSLAGLVLAVGVVVSLLTAVWLGWWAVAVLIPGAICASIAGLMLLGWAELRRERRTELEREKVRVKREKASIEREKAERELAQLQAAQRREREVEIEQYYRELSGVDHAAFLARLAKGPATEADL